MKSKHEARGQGTAGVKRGHPKKVEMHTAVEHGVAP